MLLSIQPYQHNTLGPKIFYNETYIFVDDNSIKTNGYLVKESGKILEYIRDNITNQCINDICSWFLYSHQLHSNSSK